MKAAVIPFEADLRALGGPDLKWKAELWPKQMELIQSAARFNCFGGARGPGKTYALAQKGIMRALRWPGIPILCLRKDLKDLKRTTMQKYIDVCPKELYDPKYGGQLNRGENYLRFVGPDRQGSVIHFGELKDWESYKSMTVGYIQIDEGNEVEEDAFVNLIPTLRWMTDYGECKRAECAALGEAYARKHHEHPPYQIDVCTNPSPGWIKTRFWEPWKVGHERPQHRFISATAFDNPSLPPNFIPDLLEHNTAQWVQNFVYGDWAAFENMVWPTFSRGTHLWRGRVPHETFVNIEGGIDYGGTTHEAHRTCAYLTGELPNGQFVTFWEYSKQGAASSDFFAMISLATRQYRVHGWDADSSQHRANELLRKGGVPVFDSDRSKGAVKDGVNQVHRMFAVDATKRPQLYVAEECPRLLAGIETYQLDPDTGLPAKNQDDDEVNAFRYNVMRVTRLRGSVMSRELNSRTVGQSPKARASQTLEAIRQERRDVRRRFIEQADRGLPAEVGRRGR